MEDYDTSAIGGIVKAAAIAASVLCAGAYGVLRALHTVRHRERHTWRSDLRPLRWVGSIVFMLVFLPGVVLDSMFSGMCGTANNAEFRAPDGNHRLVVYSFDCGATTDFLLVVSLLGARDPLPKHRTASRLYSHYHQEPVASGPERNFEVVWQDSRNAVVKVEDFDGKPLVEQDGVSVRFENLR